MMGLICSLSSARSTSSAKLSSTVSKSRLGLRHLGENLGQGTPAKQPGLTSQRARSKSERSNVNHIVDMINIEMFTIDAYSISRDDRTWFS